MSLHEPIFQPLFNPLMQGIYTAAGAGVPSFSHSFLSSYTADWTFTRSNEQTFLGHEGLVRTAGDGEAAFVGARRVENLVDNVYTGWAATNSATIDAAGEIVFPGVSGNESAYKVYSGEDCSCLLLRHSLEVKASGANIGKQILVVIQGNGTNFSDRGNRTITLTGEWQRVSTTVADPLTAGYNWSAGCRARIRQTGTPSAMTFNIRNSLLENISGQANQNPSSFVDSVAYYEYENGNTLASGIVTEATGAALTGLEGILLEGAGTNLCLHNRDLTDAVWTAGSCIPLLIATGRDGAASKATRVAAIGANATISQTVTSASATRAFGFDIKRVNGTGTIEITVDGGSTYTDVTSLINSSTYTRVEATQAAVTNPTLGIRIVTNGDSIDVDYSTLESSNFLSSRIETAAIAKSRIATALKRDWTLPANNMSYFVEFVTRVPETALVTGSQRVIEFNDGTINHRMMSYYQSASGLFQGQKRIGAGFASLAQHISLGYVAGDTITFAATANETQTAQWQNGTNKKALTSATAKADWTSVPTQIGLGYDPATGVGATNAFISIKTVKVWNEAKDDTFLAGL